MDKTVGIVEDWQHGRRDLRGIFSIREWRVIGFDIDATRRIRACPRERHNPERRPPTARDCRPFIMTQPS